jgi:hypothetical protein
MAKKKEAAVAAPTTRPDLLDNGIFHTTPRGPVANSRRINTFNGEKGEIEPIGQPDTILIGLNGEETESETGSFAKTNTARGNTNYYVKVATGGTDQGQLVNPRSMYFKIEDLGKISRQSGRRNFEYQKVSKAAYEDFVLFLRTRDRTFYARAARTALDA